MGEPLSPRIPEAVERQLVEGAFSLSQGQLAGIVESATDSIITIDEQQCILLFNAAAEKLFKVPAAQVLGKSIERFIPQRFRSSHSAHIREFGQTGTTTRVMGVLPALWAVRSDGTEFQIEASISQTSSGQKKLFTVILRDITQRVRSEELRACFEAVVESSDDAIISKTLEGKITSWNPSAERLFGYTAAEAISKPMMMLIPPERAPEELDILARLRRGERVEHFETVRIRKDGKSIDISATISPIRDSSGTIFGISKIARDITDRKVAQGKVRELNQELERRVVERTAQLEEANQELGSFTYTVAHDLRAPLRHIAGFAGILVEDFSPSLEDKAKNYLQRIQDGARKMGMLIDELLSLARIGQQAPCLQITGLNSLVNEVIQILQPDIEGRQVEWRLHDLPFVEGDPLLLKQVFQNLISNALKYSRPRQVAVIEIGHTQENGDSVVFVRDNGVGFSMKYADKLFGVFQRLHHSEEFEGTGVGLATVQRIIKKNQEASGSIVGRSRTGQGRHVLLHHRQIRTCRNQTTHDRCRSVIHELKSNRHSAGRRQSGRR
jgi:PAS domain S-box-containing protein